MEGIKVDDIDYKDHERKCRICFKWFGVDEHRVEITKLVEKKFRDITQLDLKLSDDYSKDVCVICNYQLTNFSQFKRNIIKAQSKLYSYVQRTNRRLKSVKEECEEVFIVQEVDGVKDEINEYRLEPEVKFFSDPIDNRELSNLSPGVKQEIDSEAESDIFARAFDGGNSLAVENLKANQEKRRKSGKTGNNICPHCDVSIVARSQMKRHIERVHFKIKNFKCDKCDYDSYFKYAMSSHMQSHIDRDTRRHYACDKCDYVTVSKDSLRGHEVAQHLKVRANDFECSVCFERFDAYTQLYRHKQRRHEEIEKYVCNFCNKALKGASALKNHIQVRHTASPSQISCPVTSCSKVCVTTKQLQNHLKTHNGDTKEICPECGLLVANKHNLDKHINRVHLKLRNFACDLCEYRGFFKFNIVEHMKKHLDISERERHHCDEAGCSFQSVSKTSLRAHKRLEHLGQKRTYTCHCGKNFSQNSSYYTHVKIVHEKLKRHSCKLCPKSFFEKAQLRNHIKSQHLKQKDLPCEVCQKMFATRKHLQSHMKYHEAPQFSCHFENCANCFYTPSQLSSHIKVHNNQRDHKCHLCEKSYFHKSHLKKHLLTHGVV